MHTSKNYQEIKNVYNDIATEFDTSRVRVWPHVSNFLSSLVTNSSVLDIGCGNGKNMLFRNDLQCKGIDLSNKLVNICKEKKLDVIEADMTCIPFQDNSFDAIITVASYHHLSNDEDRQKALNEMYRIVKPNGHILITVWAMEQPTDSSFNFTKNDELVKWKSVKTGKIYERYYHIYSKNALINEIQKLKPEFTIINTGYEQGNWFIILGKSNF